MTIPPKTMKALLNELGDPQLEIKLRGVREVLEGLGRDDLAYYI